LQTSTLLVLSIVRCSVGSWRNTFCFQFGQILALPSSFLVLLVLIFWSCFFLTCVPPFLRPVRPVCSVKDQGGDEIFFKVKKTTKMSKVFDAYAQRKGVAITSLRFLIDGDRIDAAETPKSLELEDQDQSKCARRVFVSFLFGQCFSFFF
jgi:small ubiquitin-related modifier